MDSFSKNNLKNIQKIFEEKTGVSACTVTRRIQPVRIVVAFALILCLTLGMSVFASGMFSSLEGDELGFSSTYEGNGIVAIKIENRSDKVLVFQPKLKLMLWTTGEEIAPISDDIIFSGRKIDAHSSGIMTIDLSKAYDIEMLEQPLTDDCYYFVLTNNDFAFGQDWICSVEFAETIITPIVYADPPKADKEIVAQVTEELKFYFENITYDVMERNELDNSYIETCWNLLNEFDGNVVSSVSPYMTIEDLSPSIVFDESVPLDEQYLLVGLHYHTHDYKFKLLCSSDLEGALVLSASIPSKKYKDSGTSLPLLYIFTYEKAEIASDEDYAFVYGQLNTFADLEKFKIYEDDTYVCYELSSLIYSDLREHTDTFIAQSSDNYFDEQIWVRIQNIYNYYRNKEIIGELLRICPDPIFE